MKNKDKILKATREKQQTAYKEILISWFLNRNSTSQKGMAGYI